MSKSLYEEAIADAKQLREMAEQNAKNQIIEAITPKIQRLIEKQLVGEGLETEELEDEALSSLLPDDLEAVADAEVGDVAVLDLDAMALPPAPEELSIPAGTTISVDADAGADINVAGDGSIGLAADGVEISVNGESDVLDDEIEDEDLLLSKESVRALVNLIHGTEGRKKINEMKKQLNVLHRRVRRFARILEAANLDRLTESQRKLACKHYRNLLRETITLRDQVILTEGESEFKGLQKQTDQIVKEIRKMSRRRNSKILNRIFETAEEDNKEELDELDAILTLEPADDDEAVEVEDLLADLEIEVNLEEPVETVETGAEEEVEVEEEGGEEEVELELEYDAVGETYEIDEGMLRRELRRMRRLREQEESDAVDASPAPGGLDGEVVEVDDEDLLNALADELGDPGVPAPTVESRRRVKRVAEARRRRAARNHRTNEGRKTRALQRKLVEYKKAVTSLRDQLIEMNLFNAKLLYANKLMQNRNVTSKQQRAIVEALDNAKTLREAKLLYKSLTTSLNKRSGGTLSEGRVAKTLGSSSRSTRSANPVNNGNEVDRWAVLAGIANKDN